MTIGFFIFTAVVIAVLCGMIYGLKYVLKNYIFSDKPKVDEAWRTVSNVLIAICYGLLIYVVLTSVLIMLEPLFKQLSAALSAAISQFFAFIDKLIPYAVLGGIGYAWWRSKHPKTPTTVNNAPANEVAVALARQRGLELQKFMLTFLFRIIVATRSVINAIPPDNAKGIAISSLDNQSFYMDGEVVIYQCEVQISGEITPEVEDAIRDELQDTVPKFVVDFPMLVDPTAAKTGYPAVEILLAQKSGRRVTIDAVITSEKSIPIINDRRQARVERQKRQERAGQADDPLF